MMERKPPTAVQRYFPVVAGAVLLAKVTGDAAMPALQLKDPVLAGAAMGATAAALCFLGTYTVEEKAERQWKALKRGAASLAFGIVAGSALVAIKNYDVQYLAERAAMPRIDAATVIETRPVTIADKYCHPNNRGVEISIEYQGKKMLTMCPR